MEAKATQIDEGFSVNANVRESTKFRVQSIKCFSLPLSQLEF